MPSPGSIKAGQAYIELWADSSKLGKALKGARAKLDAFAAGAKQVGSRLMSIAAGAGFVGVVAGKSFASFDDAMRKVQARSRGTAEDMAALREQARELGRTTSFTASQVGELQSVLARRGFTRSEIHAQTPAVLALARAAGEGKDALTDLLLAADLTAGAVNAWGLESKDAGNIADLMTAAVNNSALSLESLKASLAYIAPVAAQTGYSLQDTLQVLGELSNLWIEGSQAGTSFRRMMIELVKKVDELTGKQITVETEAGDFRQLTDIIRDINEATKGLSQVERLSVFEQIFGARAIAAGAGLSRQSEAAERLREALNNADGQAKKTAETMDAGLGGAIRRLLSAVEGLTISLGRALATTFDDWAKSIGRVSQRVAGFVDEHKELVVWVAKAVAAIGAAGAALFAAGVAASVVSKGLLAITVAAAAVNKVFLLLAANPVALVFVGLTAAIAGTVYLLRQANYHTAQLSTKQQEARRAGDALRKAEMGLLDELKQLAEKRKLDNDEMDRAESIIKRLEGRYGDLGLEIDGTTGSIKGLTQAEKDLHQQWKKQRMAQLEAQYIEHQANIEELLAEIKSLGSAWSFMPTEVAEAKIDALTAKVGAQRSHMKALLKVMEALRAGEEDALTRAVIKPEKTPEAPKPPTQAEMDLAARGLRKTQEAAAFEERMAKHLSDVRLQLIEDEQQRELAMLEAQYREKLVMAEKLQADETELLDAYAAERLGIVRKYEKKAAEERQQAAQERAIAEEQLQYEIARRQIRLDKQGIDERRALLELEMKRELERMAKLGVDPALVRRNFQLQRRLLEESGPGQVEQQTQGTFSARATGYLQAATARPLEDIRRNTHEMRREFGDLRRAADRLAAALTYGS
jgi:TP901 family phage tail tape measure protein